MEKPPLKRKAARKLAHAVLAEAARRQRGQVRTWPSFVLSVLDVSPLEAELIARYLKEYVDAHETKAGTQFPPWK